MSELLLLRGRFLQLAGLAAVSQHLDGTRGEQDLQKRGSAVVPEAGVRRELGGCLRLAQGPEEVLEALPKLLPSLIPTLLVLQGSSSCRSSSCSLGSLGPARGRGGSAALDPRSKRKKFTFFRWPSCVRSCTIFLACAGMNSSMSGRSPRSRWPPRPKVSAGSGLRTAAAGQGKTMIT